MNTIEIGSFKIPFSRVFGYHVLRNNNKVRVWFLGAMGMRGHVFIDFELQTAQKVDSFANALITQFEAAQYSELNDTPHFTISPFAAKKGEFNLMDTPNELVFSGFTALSYHLITIFHERLSEHYNPFISYFRKHHTSWNGFHQEVLNNYYKDASDVALQNPEIETFMFIGQVMHRLQESLLISDV